MRAALKISRATALDAYTWLVEGRAYADLGVGGAVQACGRSDVDVSGEAFRILTMSTYGRSVDRLDKMLTGYLTLRGNRGLSLTESTMLLVES